MISLNIFDYFIGFIFYPPWYIEISIKNFQNFLYKRSKSVCLLGSETEKGLFIVDEPFAYKCSPLQSVW